MKIFEVDNIDFFLIESSFAQFFCRHKNNEKEISIRAQKIINDVKKDGDQALISYSNKFDNAGFSKAQELLVSSKEIAAAKKNISTDVHKALKIAYKRIFDYHKKQLPKDFIYRDSQNVELGNIWRAVDSVGVYAPGGTASYPSSVLMSAVPAIVAKVSEIVLCTPANEGKISDVILVAAEICGIKKIYKIGGAQAIAALARGTKTISRVNKIVGPGNSYVASAKKMLYGEVGIDMIAGPTDITIICDDDNDPAWIAADALSQLEHGADSKAFIITNNKNFAQKIIAKIAFLKKNLPRKNIIEKSLKNSAIIIVKNFDDAVSISNFIAPEHLEISCKNAKNLLAKIKNAGAVFLGKYSPEAIGDYIAGPSHTLPTEGTAKFASGLSVYDFLKRISLISCDKNSFATIASYAAILADCEGLHAHKLSIDCRGASHAPVGV